MSKVTNRIHGHQGTAIGTECNHWFLAKGFAPKLGDEVDCPVCADTEKQIKAARVEAEQALAGQLNNPGGDYYAGLRCGVEDRQISDRYEAAEYGWDQAFSYIESVLEATNAN